MARNVAKVGLHDVIGHERVGKSRCVLSWSGRRGLTPRVPIASFSSPIDLLAAEALDFILAARERAVRPFLKADVVQHKIGPGNSWVARTLAVGACLAASIGCNSRDSAPPYPSECPSTLCQTLKDTSAGRLSLVVSLEEESSIPSMTSIRVEFQAPQGAKYVDFVAGEHVSCDGATLRRFPAAFGRDVLTTSIAGRTVKCVYTSAQRSTLFGFSVPDQLEILAPGNHERVRRGPQTTVTYKNRVPIRAGGRARPVAESAFQLRPSARAPGAVHDLTPSR